ncbi:hypothetical protein PT2222_110076 [Paraburkholderia tropica]
MKPRSGLPAAAERLEHRHLIERDLLRGLRERRVHVHEAALRVEHAERIERARAELALGEREGASVLGARRLQRMALAPRRAVTRERLLGFLQGAQHARIERGARAGVVGTRRAQFGTARRQIRKAPANQRADTPRHRIPVADRCGIARRRQPVHRAAQHDGRIQRRLRRADAGMRRREFAFGLAQIGTATQQRRAIAERKRLRERGRRAALHGGRRNLGRRMTREHREFVERGAALAFEHGQTRARVVGESARAGEVHRRDEAQRLLPRRERGDALGHLLRALRHVDTRAKRTGPRVGARGFGGDAHAHGVGGGLLGVGVGMRGIDEIVHASPQIDLPRQRETRRPAEARRRAAAVACGGHDLVVGVAAVIDAERRLRGGQVRGVGLREHGAGAFDARGGHGEIAVLRERVADQRVERGIVVEPPPVIGRRGAHGVGRRSGGVERRGALGGGHGRAISLGGRARGETRSQRSQRSQRRHCGGQ